MRRQRAVKGGRERIGAGVEKRIRAAVEREARRFGVSMAFVQAVAIADALGVELEAEDRYDGRQRDSKPYKGSRAIPATMVVYPRRT